MATAEIHARAHWNATGIMLRPDRSYRISVVAADDWRDASIATTPAGYELPHLRLFRWARRVRGAPWFALIGAIGRSLETVFVIGNGIDHFKPKHDGELCCFANDVFFMYWNNHGALTIEVTESDEEEAT